LKVTEGQLSDLRSDLHRYVDEILDLEPMIRDLAITNGDEEKIETVGRSKGTHSDPTSRAALENNRFRMWTQAAHKLTSDLQRLRDFAKRYAGEPIQRCQGCDMPILDDQRAHGKRWHHKCYMRKYRGRL
jgi:hypothetical protein